MDHLLACRIEAHDKCLEVITMHQPNFESGKGLWIMTPKKLPCDIYKKLLWIFSRNIQWYTLITLL